MADLVLCHSIVFRWSTVDLDSARTNHTILTAALKFIFAAQTHNRITDRLCSNGYSPIFEDLWSSQAQLVDDILIVLSLAGLRRYLVARHSRCGASSFHVQVPLLCICPPVFCMFFQFQHVTDAQLYTSHPDSCTHMGRTGLEFHFVSAKQEQFTLSS